MLWPLRVPGAPLLMTIWRHTCPQALVNGYDYWRCIATVWLWEYPVQIASRFLGGICFHLDEDDVGSWRFFTISITGCNFAGAYLGYPPAATLLASFVSINDNLSSHSPNFARRSSSLSRSSNLALWEDRLYFVNIPNTENCRSWQCATPSPQRRRASSTSQTQAGITIPPASAEAERSSAWHISALLPPAIQAPQLMLRASVVLCRTAPRACALLPQKLSLL